ncbi:MULTISPECIES: hypothetical protein [Bacillus cereus group]|nr:MULTISPECIES: hypothetical protein [Bacillus cereus group]
MKKIMTLVTSLALIGVLFLTPSKEQKEQPKNEAPVILYMVDPGGGMG